MLSYEMRQSIVSGEHHIEIILLDGLQASHVGHLKRDRKPALNCFATGPCY